jgi:hypothetical protein
MNAGKPADPSSHVCLTAKILKGIVVKPTTTSSRDKEESDVQAITSFIALIAIASVFVLGGDTVHAQTWQPPTDSERCPSKWGAGDQRGSGNHMKPESVLRAVRLIKSGEVIELGHVLSSSMPFFGTRRFDVHTKRTFMNPQSNRRGSNEELVVGEIGQVGT